MAYWLLKTEPETYSFADLENEGTTRWEGVSNNLALKHLRTIKKDDFAFIYHTGKEKAVVGIAEAVKGPYPDPSGNDPKHVVVDIKVKQRLQRAVTLAELKSDKSFASFELVRMPRLSVMPVSSAHWNAILKKASAKP